MRIHSLKHVLFLLHLLLHTCTSFKEPVNLDTKCKVPSDDIEKIAKFRNWTTFKIRDSVNKRIGDINHGSIKVIEDSSDDISERTVFFKPLKRASERYIMKVVTIKGETPHTIEFLIHDNDFEKTCVKVVRDPMDINIKRIDSPSVKSTYSENGWIEYAIRNELSLQYRMGNITDGDIPIVYDPTDANVRLRYVHVTRRDLIDVLMTTCLPFLPVKPTIVRVFTYYYEGERSFDEFIESYRNGSKEYIELVRKPVTLNLGRTDSALFKRYKIDSETFVYTISQEHKNEKKIGRVINRNLIITNDYPNSRLRSVYVNKKDSQFECIEVKTCSKRGECKRCKYVLEDDRYVQSSCNNIKENTQDPGSTGNLFNSSEELDKPAIRQALPYLRGVVSFQEMKNSTEDITIDISNTRSNHFIADVLPNHQGLYYSLIKEMTEKDRYLNVYESDKLLTRIHLEKAKSVELLVRKGEEGENRVFIWIKCGAELYKGHEIVVIDSLRQTGEYISRKIEKKQVELIEAMIN